MKHVPVRKASPRLPLVPPALVWLPFPQELPVADRVGPQILIPRRFLDAMQKIRVQLAPRDQQAPSLLQYPVLRSSIWVGYPGNISSGLGWRIVFFPVALGGFVVQVEHNRCP